MACFFLAEIEVHAAAPYREYVEKASEIVSRYGGEYVFRSEAITPVSEDWAPKRMVLIKFGTRDELRQVLHLPRVPGHQTLAGALDHVAGGHHSGINPAAQPQSTPSTQRNCTYSKHWPGET